MTDSNYLESYCTPKQSIAGVNHTSRVKRPRAKRTLETLNLIDSYLFNASTERIQDAELVARIVIERATGQKLNKVIVEPEKQLKGIETDRRGIRMDLFISEFDNGKIAKIYDIEPNNYDLYELPMRDRYNQAMSDVKRLGTGERFSDLPQFISIWILPEDPFGGDRMIYTVKNMVEENNEIVYNDGIVRLFLNAKGHIGGDDKLRALLTYFCDSSKANAIDPELEKLHSIVTGVRCSKEVGERYMTWQDYIDYEVKLGKQELKEELCDEVVAEVRQEVVAEVRQEVVAEVRQEVVAEVRIDMLKSFVATFIKLGKTKEDIVQVLVGDYHMLEQEAQDLVGNVS